MPNLPRSPQTLYAAAILAALVAVIVFARRQQREPASPSLRAAPSRLHWPREKFSEPEPLATPERAPSIQNIAAENTLPAGFPEDESDDLGPIREQETYDQNQKSPQAPRPAMQRLSTVAEEEASETATLRGPAKPQATSPPPGPTPVIDEAALESALQQAAQLNRRAESLARRRAYYLARNLTVQSFRNVAETLDLQAGSGEHTAALASALTALREAEDFQSRSLEDSTVNVPLIVAGHRTVILRKTGNISPIDAQQQYLSFAQEQLVVAAGGQPVASHGLCILGKLQLRLKGAEARPTDLARATVYQQAALAVDCRNYPAANELGSILTALGRLPEARRVLQESVGTSANSEGWHRLAVVHERLGETELAAQAREQEAMLSGGPTGTRPKVEWVPPEVFAGNAPRTAAAQPKQKGTSSMGVMR